LCSKSPETRIVNVAVGRRSHQLLWPAGRTPREHRRYSERAAVTVLPHQLQMRSLVVATKPFIPHFRKLDQHFADGPRAAFFDYVLAHEAAIAERGRRVLTHDEDPLAPVEALLGNVPK
jgi:hypothetical protein